MHSRMLLFQMLKAASAFIHTLTPSYRDHVCCFCTFLCDFCFYDYMLLPILINTFLSLAPCYMPKQCLRNRWKSANSSEYIKAEKMDKIWWGQAGKLNLTHLGQDSLDLDNNVMFILEQILSTFPSLIWSLILSVFCFHADFICVSDPGNSCHVNGVKAHIINKSIVGSEGLNNVFKKARKRAIDWVSFLP